MPLTRAGLITLAIFTFFGQLRFVLLAAGADQE